MGSRSIEPGRVLVVGAGIAGLSTAIRLHQEGWDPVIVERASQRRTGGYFIATMGTGQAAAQRLGILECLPDRTPPRSAAVYDMDRTGRRRPTLGLFDLPMTPKPMLMLRGDVENALFEALPAGVQVRFSTVPTAITQDPEGVDVTLHDSATGIDTVERYELVVGADGLRSTVRLLAFGPHECFLRPLNHMIAAFELPEPPLGLEPAEGAMQFEPNRSLIIYAFADHPPTALFSYRCDDIDAEFAKAPIDRLRDAYGPAPYGELFDDVLAAFEKTETFSFDSVQQVDLDSWHRGRVVLVGDSAWCPTLYSGMGSSTAMAGADLLGTVLAENPGSLEAALTEWERRLRPHTDNFQKLGADGALAFSPPNRFRIGLRRAFTWARENRYTAPLMNWAMARSPRMACRNVDIVAVTQTTTGPYAEKLSA